MGLDKQIVLLVCFIDHFPPPLPVEKTIGSKVSSFILSPNTLHLQMNACIVTKLHNILLGTIITNDIWYTYNRTLVYRLV